MLVIRKATAGDAPLLIAMIRELAEFEHELDQVDITSEDLLRDGFRSSPCFQALIAEWGGQTAAYALYFFTYSTWAGRPSLFVEDLFVRAEFRRKGIGKALLKPWRLLPASRIVTGCDGRCLIGTPRPSIFTVPLEPNHRASCLPCSLWGIASKSLAGEDDQP